MRNQYFRKTTADWLKEIFAMWHIKNKMEEPICLSATKLKLSRDSLYQKLHNGRAWLVKHEPQGNIFLEQLCLRLVNETEIELSLRRIARDAQFLSPVHLERANWFMLSEIGAELIFNLEEEVLADALMDKHPGKLYKLHTPTCIRLVKTSL